MDSGQKVTERWVSYWFYLGERSSLSEHFRQFWPFWAEMGRMFRTEAPIFQA